MATTPEWLNIEALVGERIVDDLGNVRAEAQALAQAVRELAIKAYKATCAWDYALARHQLPDEVWAVAKDACGAEATFEALRGLIDDLQIAQLEKPQGDPPEWFERARLEAGKTLLDEGP